MMSTKQSHRILFLHSELAGYFLACTDALSSISEVAAIQIVHWPVHVDAPFEIDSHESITFTSKESLSRKDLDEQVSLFNPTAIFVSGWMDSDYLEIAKTWHSRATITLCMDNWWKGSLRQWLGVLGSRWLLRTKFHNVWVPGQPQYRFARKLGFPDARIFKKYYCANPSPFLRTSEGSKLDPNETEMFRKLLYIGRYDSVKGIQELWDVFEHRSALNPTWELHCVGTGPLWNQRPTHPKIFHYGFLQPGELREVVFTCNAFVMPSKHEPWGVVLHEMALAGLPLLVSNQVGASELFLNDGANGFSFEFDQLDSALEKLFRLSDDARSEMGLLSKKLGLTWQPAEWAGLLVEMIQCDD